MKRLYLFSLVLFGASAALTAQADRQGAEILKSIVKIQAAIPKDARSAQSLGTEREGHGVVIDEMGHILTIGYLVSEAERIEITLRGGKKMSASFVGYDFYTGFGLLRADGRLDIVPMKLGDSSRIAEGDQVIVAGFGGAQDGGPYRRRGWGRSEGPCGFLS